MKVIVPAHVYELPGYLKPDVNSQLLHFVHKFDGQEAGGTWSEGTTTEDVLNVLIDRLQTFQQGQWPCEENDFAITHLQAALEVMERRTADREARGVEGRPQQ
jgi:hypothetical protein